MEGVGKWKKRNTKTRKQKRGRSEKKDGEMEDIQKLSTVYGVKDKRKLRWRLKLTVVEDCRLSCRLDIERTANRRNSAPVFEGVLNFTSLGVLFDALLIILVPSRLTIAYFISNIIIWRPERYVVE